MSTFRRLLLSRMATIILTLMLAVLCFKVEAFMGVNKVIRYNYRSKFMIEKGLDVNKVYPNFSVAAGERICLIIKMRSINFV